MGIEKIIEEYKLRLQTNEKNNRYKNQLVDWELINLMDSCHFLSKLVREMEDQIGEQNFLMTKFQKLTLNKLRKKIKRINESMKFNKDIDHFKEIMSIVHDLFAIKLELKKVIQVNKLKIADNDINIISQIIIGSLKKTIHLKK